MPYSGSPAAPTSRPTTRSTTPASATSCAATSRARATRPRATRRRPARSAWRSRTSGPGATNLVTADRRRDARLGADGLHHRPGPHRPASARTASRRPTRSGITMPIVKHSFQVLDPREIPHMIHEAFHVARTGRPGPGAASTCRRTSRAPTSRTTRPRRRRSTCPATRTSTRATRSRSGSPRRRSRMRGARSSTPAAASSTATPREELTRARDHRAASRSPAP